MELELSRLIDALPGLVWTALPDGRAEFLNQRWCEYTGLSLERAIGYGWQTALHPQDAVLTLKSLRSFLEAGRGGEVQARLRRHDGEYRRFLMSTTPISDTSGRIVRWCGINTDIEDWLRAEEALHAQGSLKASEAELRRTQAHFTVAQRLSATGSFVSDLMVNDNFWSEELYRIFEVDRSTRPTVQSVRDVVHPDDLHEYDSAIERAMAGHDVDFEFRIIPAGSALKHLRCSARVSEHISGRPVFMGAIQDVTASKQSEAELRRAYEFLAEAQHVSRTGSFLTDLLAEDHHWSDELYRIFEIDPTTKVTVQLVRDVVHAEDLAAFDSGIQRSMQGENFDQVFRIVTQHGHLRYVHAVARVIEQVAGRPLFIGAIQDVTDSKVAEEALSRARSELTHVARVMTLGTLTASIAHEVNQPLSGIITNASTCLRMLAADPPNLEGARATAQRTLRDGNRASEVIQRLRTLFARGQPKTERVDLNDAAREVLALSAGELRSSRVMLQTDFAEDLPAVTGDRVQLQQVILNLVLNAADAMKAVDDRPRDLLIRTAHEDTSNITLSVRDSGTGIEPDNLDKVFEAFYTTKSHGMGIGLAISHSIIERHAGRLWASPNEGYGATFTFSVPCTTNTML